MCMELSTGTVIKRARQRKGLTQNELADLLGVSKSTVQKYENGYVENLKLDTIRSLCIHLDILTVMLIFPEDPLNRSDFNYYQINHIITAFHQLNYLGQGKVYDYILDLLVNEKYQDLKANTRNTL